ncbi:hypothetical protein H5410_042492 [Solanum commersonii]|uniref:Uncharacterized protein n=1 Tax=Solanum commersonii TaxID=4109 RepID=A0A9J5XW66_SOLCO|nr:hypothetical protein H5410_042492 [Solanum commersonii]
MLMSSIFQEIVQPNGIADFDDFSTRPPEQLLRRSSRVSDTSSPPPPLKRKKKGDTPKTKVSEPSQPDQSNVSLNQPFSISDGPPRSTANVHDLQMLKKSTMLTRNLRKL